MEIIPLILWLGLNALFLVNFLIGLGSYSVEVILIGVCLLSLHALATKMSCDIISRGPLVYVTNNT